MALIDLDNIDLFKKKSNLIVDDVKLTHYDHFDWENKIKNDFPNGMKITVHNDIDKEGLDSLIMYPNERWLNGKSNHPETKTVESNDNLRIEVLLNPQNYYLVHPDRDYYNYELEEQGLSEEDCEITMFLNQHDNISEGQIVVCLENDQEFMQNCYVEGVQMCDVASLYLRHGEKWNDNEFKEVLQLFALKDNTYNIIDNDIPLVGAAEKVRNNVYADIQYMYTGKTPVKEHRYYETDIRPKYAHKLAEAAELELRKRGLINTYPQSFDVRWANNRGDNWECEQMVKSINDMYRGYAEKIVDATQNKDWSRVNIYTTNPKYRYRIMETLTHSWARREIKEVINPNELPKEIAEAQKTLKEKQLASLKGKIFSSTGSIYFTEEGTNGLALITKGRELYAYGEPFNLDNTDRLNELIQKKNVLYQDKCHLSLVGEERVFLSLLTGMQIKLRAEIIDDKEVFVHCFNKTVFPVEEEKDYLVDITNRITDARVYKTNQGKAIRCKIDGVQQMGKPIKYIDMIKYDNGNFSLERLTTEYFASELIGNGNNQIKNIKR